MVAELLRNFPIMWYSLPVSLASTVIFFIGLFVFCQNRRPGPNSIFFLICLCVNFWLYGISVMCAVKDPDLALVLYKTVTFLGVAFVSPCVYWFSAVWLKRVNRQKATIVLALTGGGLFYLCGLLTPWSFKGVYRYFWGYYPRYGVFSVLFLLFFFGFFLAAFYNFIGAYRNEGNSFRKTQIKLIAVAFLISLTGSVDYLPKFFYLSIYPLGYIPVFTWIMLVGYSIVKYKVMDIETVIHQTILWTVTSAVVLLPILAIFYALKNWYQETNAAVFALFLTAMFFGFYGYVKTVQPRIDHVFQRRKHDLETALTRFNDSLVHLKGLRQLASYVVQTVHEVLYVDRVQIFLKNSGDQKLIRIDVTGDGLPTVSCDDPFVRHLEKDDEPAQGEFIDADPRFNDVAEQAKAFFHQLGVKVCIPLVLNGELIGLINLGQKANLKPFRAAEIKFLSDLRRAATIALSNSLRLIEMQESLRKWNEELEEKVKLRTKELEEAQKQLVQAEKLATIGTLAGGVAHEINNPLTAILTNAQMLQMSITGDEDMESVKLIEEGAKRCQAIVQKLMKYARKPVREERADTVDLNRVIENVLSFLNYQLDQDNIQLVKQLAPVAQIRGVNNELEQVFTNIILNAKDAIKGRSGTGIIHVETYEKNGSVCAKIVDDGIGIPQEILRKIFDPFFTTKDVGKGTGLGLSITYGIVEKHGGKIDVESQVGVGSIFTVSLPKGESH